MTITQLITSHSVAFFAGCVVTYIIKKANEYQRPQLPDREFDQEAYDREYGLFVAEQAKHCRCDHGVCDGVLAGGMCDEIRHDPTQDREDDL